MQEGNSHSSDPDGQCADSFRRDSGNVGRKKSALSVKKCWTKAINFMRFDSFVTVIQNAGDDFHSLQFHQIYADSA